MNRNGVYYKIIFTGILITLIFIAIKIGNQNENLPQNSHNVYVDSTDKFVEIAPNIIGVLDEGVNSGKERLIIFRYDPTSKEFEIETILDYVDVLAHPDKYGLTK